MACAALGCKSRMGMSVISENNTRLSFHRFPKDPNVRAKWIKNLKRNDWTPSKFSRLCSLHFDDTCYRIGYQTKTLHSDAVPTIFPAISSYPVKKSLKRSRRSQPESPGPSTINNSNQDNIVNLKSTLPGPSTINNSNQDNIVNLKSTLPGPSTINNSNQDNIVNLKSTLPGPSTINNSNQDHIVNLKSTLSTQKEIISKLLQRLWHHKIISAKRVRALKCMRQKSYRITKKLADTKNIINDLRTKLKMDEEKIELMAPMPENNNDLLKRHALKQKNISVEREYSTDLKKFAVTLNLISPKAYEYVRQNFGTALPHVKSISRWCQGLDCGPGFTQEALE